MQTLHILPWSETLAADVVTYPDYLLHRLAQAGVGCVDAELPSAGEDVVWRFTAHSRSRKQELGSLPSRRFRPVLARFATMLEMSMYAGHALFAVSPLPGWPTGTHRFSLFLCNEPTMGVWLRLYLYCIDGIWPSK